MTTSNRVRAGVAGLALSATAFVGFLQHEGFRDEAYYATAEEKARGINTIGFGTTEDVNPGDKITVEAALVRALRDSAKFEGAIKRCVKVPLHQYEYDAAVQLAYNIGESAFCRSTVVKRFNAGDYEGACDAFLMWDKQSGRVLRGLTKRREAERKLCLGLGAAGDAKGAEKAVAPVSNGMSVPNGFVGQSKAVGPVAQVQSLSAVFVGDAGTAIPHLGFAAGPATVVRGVGAVVVDPVEGGPDRGLPHVGQKVLKDLPPLTNQYASATVVGVGNGGGVSASLPHPRPGVVRLPASLPVAKHWMRGVECSAPTGLLAPVPCVVAKDFNFNAAIAQEQPPRLPVPRLVFDALDGNEAAKPLPSEINEFHMRAMYAYAANEVKHP